MRAYAAALAFALLAASSAWAQNTPQVQNVSAPRRAAEATSPDYTALYCAGFVTSDKVATDSYVISGEESQTKLVFTSGDYVFINKGSAQGVKPGDRFDVVRPDKDPLPVQWFKWQNKLSKAMGTYYVDSGQIKVINVQPNVSTAIITHSCEPMQRGDLIRTFTERPAPPYKPSDKFDHFAPVSGKPVGMLVFGTGFTQTYGKYSSVYVNLGVNQGVKVGDYMRVFRYEGSHAETIPNYHDFQYKMFGFGSTPRSYSWNDIPRDVIGEGIVISVGPNSSTLFVTYTVFDIYAGDYAEVE